MVAQSKLPQEKIDEAQAFIDEGWALHQSIKGTHEDDRHYETLELLFQTLDILEAE